MKVRITGSFLEKLHNALALPGSGIFIDKKLVMFHSIKEFLKTPVGFPEFPVRSFSESLAR
jgi:hypothetical protein